MIPTCFKKTTIVLVPKQPELAASHPSLLPSAQELLQGCMLHPLVYSVYHSIAKIFVLKFANSTNIVDLISDAGEMAYREDQAMKVSKTKEMILDCRKRHEGACPDLHQWNRGEKGLQL